MASKSHIIDKSHSKIFDICDELQDYCRRNGYKLLDKNGLVENMAKLLGIREVTTRFTNESGNKSDKSTVLIKTKKHYGPSHLIKEMAVDEPEDSDEDSSTDVKK